MQELRIRCNDARKGVTTVVVLGAISRPLPEDHLSGKTRPEETLRRVQRADGVIGLETEERSGLFEFPGDGPGVWWRVVKD